MGNRIKELRKALGLTQQEFADRIGVKRGAIANYEIGRNASDTAVALICREFGVSEHWLRTGEGEMFRTTPKTNQKLEEALTIFRTLRPEFQDYALEQIRLLAKLQEK